MHLYVIKGMKANTGMIKIKFRIEVTLASWGYTESDTTEVT